MRDRLDDERSTPAILTERRRLAPAHRATLRRHGQVAAARGQGERVRVRRPRDGRAHAWTFRGILRGDDGNRVDGTDLDGLVDVAGYVHGVEYSAFGCEGEAVVVPGIGALNSEVEELVTSRSGQVCDASKSLAHRR